VDRIISLDALRGMNRQGVIDLLYRMADDELILGHRNVDWKDQAPEAGDRAAYESIAKDELSHARSLYEFLNELGEADVEALIANRQPRQFRCAALVALPSKDWPFSVMRQFLYDAAKCVRLKALSTGVLVPMARLAAAILEQKKRHLAHGRAWVLRISGAGEVGLDSMQQALALAYPCALGLFEPTESDEVLAQAGICPREEELQHEWESAVVPVLSQAGLTVDSALRPVYGGRVGRHSAALAEVVDGLSRRATKRRSDGAT